MPKRKRSSPSPTQSQPLGPAARQKKLCTQRLATAQKSLLTALRLGAGFERQKHSRRKKYATSKKDTKSLARIEAEYAVLKGLDMEKVADQHLRRTVGKVKSLKEAEAMQEYINGGGVGTEKGYEGRGLAKDPATLNVTARLYKVPAVKKVVDEVVEYLKGVVGAPGASSQVPDAQKDAPKKGEKQKDKDMLDVSDEEGDPYNAFRARIAKHSSGEEESEDSITGDERPPSIGESESEHDPEADLDEESEDPEAYSSPTSSEAEDATEGDERSKRQILVPSASVSNADSESDNESLVAPSKAKKAKALKDEKPTSSAFVPALSHAAYFSGSESEASDLDEAPRKNRRGQRARQKIAEAKFGAKAKHLEKEDRSSGWDAKRGAVGDHKHGRGDRGGAPKGRGPHQSGGNAEPLGQKKSGGVKRDDKGELHPSWQAAKAAKESKKLKIDVQGAKPQGKKVVFD